MYKHLIRPVLFRLSPETVHHLVVLGVKAGFKIPGVAPLVKKFCEVKNPKLKRTVFGLEFENPVGLAAGFDKNATFFNEFSNFGFSFIEIGTVTPKPQPGNPKPRSFRVPNDKALINRMGFNNNGVDEAIKNLKKRHTNIIIGGNLGKNTLTPNEEAIDDYKLLFNKLYDYVDYFVVNVSCPNISDLHKLQDKDSLMSILNCLMAERTNKSSVKPILLKISPDLNFAQIDEVIDIVNETRIDGLVATNTTTGRYNLSITEDEIAKIGNGGMSGKPIKNRSTEIIRYISQKTGGKLPIIGVGGIMTPDDAIEKLEAGASLVQVYSGFIYEGPMLVKRINKLLLNR
ncbi:MAG: quinone-dependent dihydroorotate dehydrogenase [Bacteroidota bacterium]|nr:quinone-dependent dihydroorotate dehydrogenase [Bacteroidota bacterium]